MQWVLDNAPALFSEIHEQAHQMEADSAKLALLLTNFEKMAATVENARERPPSNREARESGEAEDGGEEDDAQPESPRRAWSAPPSSLGRTDSADLRAAVKSTQMMKQTINAFTASQKARRRARRRNATASSSVLAELGDNGDLVETVRRTIVAIQTASDRAVGLLQNIVRERDATSRADNLLALDELVGSKPARSWQDEWVAMVCEHHQTTEFKVDDDCPPISTLSEKELSEYVSKRFSIEHYTQKHADYIAVTVATGWPEERADIFQHLSYVKAPIARALRDGDPCYAASTYALCDAFFDQRRDTADAETSGPLPPQLYTHLDGPSSLTFNEPSWKNILEPDVTGFRGHTCSALVTADCAPERMDARGHMAFNRATKQLEPVPSDIVRFESLVDDAHGAHAPVMFQGGEYGAFPPNTLFRLKTILKPGTWTGPGGVKPQQKLIVVTATYRKGTSQSTESKHSAKLCGAAVTLHYGDREIFVRGLAHVLTRPTLTMPLEFQRSFTWHDWKGVTYSLAEEWRYVTGPSFPKEGCTPGTRDAGNAGKTPKDFLDLVNAFIRERRAQGHGTALLETDAMLNENEVLAVRLYSGPAYQPINTFLREVSRLTDDYQERVARHPQLTFCATVQHIINAIRKLAAVCTPAEATEPLYRGVRGELPHGFWVPDKAGMICGVEMGFMSTSRSIETPIRYMDRSGNNILWALQPRLETDEAFHRGADVAMLSQFEAEREVLFPPYTLLRVRERQDGLAEESVEEERSLGTLLKAARAKQLTGAPSPGRPPPMTPSNSSINSQMINKYSQGQDTPEAAQSSARRVSAPPDETAARWARVPEQYAVPRSRKGIRYLEVLVEPSFI